MEEKLASGHIVRRLTGKDAEYLEKMYAAFNDGAIKLEPGGFLFPTSFVKYSELIWNFKFQPTDISVLTFVKSGTTWVQDIVWNLVHNPNLDNPLAKMALEAKFPDTEGDMYFAISGSPIPDPNDEPMQLLNKYFPGRTNYSVGDFLYLASLSPPPRLFKHHRPLSLFPPSFLDDSKIIYIARDPRDVVLSYYHFARIHKQHDFKGSLDDLIDGFISDLVVYTPYWNHIKLAWEKRNHPNMCFIFYEDLHEDIFSQVKRIDKFLGTNRSDEQLRNVIEFSSFSNMKERCKDNPPTSGTFLFFKMDVVEKEGGFFREGKSGDWRDKLTSAQAEKMNSWMAKNLPQFGEDFKYKV